jgi:hypothetical protein
MAVRKIHPHLHVLDPVRFERIEVGMIYPDLPRLTRLNSPPINADGYLDGWRASALFGKGIADAYCWLSSIEAPALNTLTRKIRSRAFLG